MSVKMSAKYTIQPPDLNECKSYEAFKRKLKAWADVTDLTKKKQGNFIALSLPNKSKFGDDLRERAFEKLSLGELKEDNGLDKLIEFLDEELGKNAVDEIIEKWEEFDNCKRAANQIIHEFSNDFEVKYNRIKQSTSKIPEEIRFNHRSFDSNKMEELVLWTQIMHHIMVSIKVF